MPLEPIDRLVERGPQTPRDRSERVHGAEGVAFPWQELRSQLASVAPERARDALETRGIDARIRRSVQREDGRAQPAAGREHVEALAVRLEVLQDLHAQRQLLSRAGVEHRDLPLAPPLLFGRFVPAVELADRGPRRHGAVVARLAGVDQRHSPAAAVPEDPRAGGVEIAQRTRARERAHALDVLELPRERAAPEGVRLAEALEVRADAGARGVEADGRQSRAREPPGELGEEAPVHEALEAVQDQHPGPRSACARGQRRAPAHDAARLAFELELEGPAERRDGGLLSAHPNSSCWPSTSAISRRPGNDAISSAGARTRSPLRRARSSRALANAFAPKWLLVTT